MLTETQSINAAEAALLAQFPVVVVPPRSAMAPLEKNGQRMLLANDGMYIEVRRDWLYAVRKCGALADGLMTPYGTVQQTTRLPGAIPRQLVEQFIEAARQACPLELGAVITYDLATREWALRMSRSLHASAAALSYEIPDLGTTERRVVDIHSHGSGHAFISSIDKRDTRGATAIVMVVGRLDDDQAEVIAYLYLQGIPFPIIWKPTDDDREAVLEDGDVPFAFNSR